MDYQGNKIPKGFRVKPLGPYLEMQSEDLAQQSTYSKLPTLQIDLYTGQIQIIQKETIKEGYKFVYGIYGLHFCEDHYLVAFVDKLKQVGVIKEYPVYQITGTNIIEGQSNKSINKYQQRLRQHFRKGVNAADQFGFGRQYTAQQYDLTSSYQAQKRDSRHNAQHSVGQPPPSLDSHYLWNHHLLKPLLDAGAWEFVVPAIQGFVQTVSAQLPEDFASFSAVAGASGAELRGLVAPCPADLRITLVCRRSTERAGTRHWRRGADSEGNAANFVVTEQLVNLVPWSNDNSNSHAQKLPKFSSFLQVRGSIPFPWAQVPNLKYKPKFEIATDSRVAVSFSRHINKLLIKYKTVLAINLVKQHGSEASLSRQFNKQAEVFNSSRTARGPCRLVNFDLHKECKGGNMKNLDRLWDIIQQQIMDMGVFIEGPEDNVEQQGIVRCNCIDSLDRTNQAQAYLATRMLEQSIGYLLGPGGGQKHQAVNIEEQLPSLSSKLRYLWADHGDAVAEFYAGTGALKGNVTRTGKQTTLGLLDDGWMSMVRYHKNNFVDGERQDIVDFVLGKYIPAGQDSSLGVGDKAVASSKYAEALLKKAKPQINPVLPFTVLIGLSLYSIFKVYKILPKILFKQFGLTLPIRAVQALAAKYSDDGQTSLYKDSFEMILPVLATYLCYWIIKKLGKKLVSKPKLCPLETKSW